MSDEIKYCSMCGRSEEDAGMMMRMPMGMNVCQSCMDKLSDMMDDQMKNIPPNASADLSRFMTPYAFNQAGTSQTDDSGEDDASSEEKAPLKDLS